MAQSTSEYQQWKQQYIGDFKQYKDDLDREFANFLKQQWKPFGTEKGRIRDKTPKPVQIPVVQKPEKKIVKAEPSKSLPSTEPKPDPVQAIPQVEPEDLNLPEVIPSRKNERLVSFGFLGHKLDIPDLITDSQIPLKRRITQEQIQQRFTALAVSEYSETLKHLLDLKQGLNLNDWAYLKMVEQFSGQLEIGANNRVLASWYLLLKSGLDARVAFSDERIYLLLASRQNLYDIAYFRYDEKKYYAVSLETKLPRKLYSYDGRYPKKLTVSDFSPRKKLNSRQAKKLRRLEFSYNSQSYRLAVPYNLHNVDFLATYPQMDIEQYFHSPVNDITANALLSQLGPVVADKSQTEAVNLLLSFVQNAFHYQTDGEQFGAENYMFIEETLHYSSSDCEDRSIIFAWLVRQLLGIDVVGIEFPGHIATAVALDKPTGSIVVRHQKEYSIADPTYINARVGMRMPRYRDVPPKVIPIL